MEDTNGLTLDVAPGRNGSATLTAKLAGDVLHVDKLDLSKAKHRETFAKAVCGGRPGIKRDALDAELLKLAADVAGKAEAKDNADDSAPDRLATMLESIRAEARAMLENPDLLKRVVDDVGILGVAGEKELAATLYLVGTSRLLDRPLV